MKTGLELREELAICREEGKRARAASREAKAAYDAAHATEDEKVAEANGSTATTHPEPKAPAPRKAGQRCHCGCGGVTKGGLFMMGHDMRLKSQLYAIARNPKKKTEVNTELTADRVAATAEILARGWHEMRIPDAIRKAARKGRWDAAPDVIIDTRVKERYGE